MIAEIKNIKSREDELRKFGLTVGLVLGLLGGLFLWRGRDYYHYFLIPSFTLIFFGLFFPLLLKPIHKAWMGLAIIMGWVMTRVVLTVLFFVIVTPISLLARLSGKEFLNKKFKTNSNTNSYWIPKERVKRGKSNYERQF